MKKILVAEDDIILRKIIEITLIGENFQLVYAINGTQLIEMAQVEKPDVIITKFKLPGLSATELIKRLRSEENTASIPIIIIGANEGFQDIQNGKDIGAVTLLPKPFSPMKFLAHLDLLLKEQKP